LTSNGIQGHGWPEDIFAIYLYLNTSLVIFELRLILTLHFYAYKLSKKEYLYIAVDIKK